ncbi:MAG: 4Fe-4S binding protein [Desulfobacterales bacterium]|nr:4Fe-4S binding protein [Desulfobacterales bacterium]
MYSKILMLQFPITEAQKPVVCNLAKHFDLTFNILKATILPRKEGVMVLELSGSRKNFNDGVNYLKSQGVDIKTADSEVKRSKKKCIHCGACTAVCPTGALSIQRPEMTVIFDQSKCSICQLCVPACPTRAMEVRPLDQLFFE